MIAWTFHLICYAVFLGVLLAAAAVAVFLLMLFLLWLADVRQN